MLARQTERETFFFQVFAQSIQCIPYLLAWGLFLSPMYYALLGQQFQVFLLIVPWIVLATLFLPAALAQNPAGMIDTLVASLQALKYNFVHTFLFLSMLTVVFFVIGLGILQYAKSSQMLMLFWSLIIVLMTVRDVFAGSTAKLL